jgi:hypothetical protein
MATVVITFSDPADLFHRRDHARGGDYLDDMTHTLDRPHDHDHARHGAQRRG